MLTHSLKEFYEKNPEGYAKMVKELSKELEKNKEAAKNFKEVEIKRLRSAILHRMQKYGIDTTSWATVNKFLEQPRIAGKRLYDLSTAEMGDLIPKLESILRKDFEKKEMERSAAQQN